RTEIESADLGYARYLKDRAAKAQGFGAVQPA
ncbi:MAG: hypothetical protein RL216_477, partial [Pseudomonadota bacterium]